MEPDTNDQAPPILAAGTGPVADQELPGILTPVELAASQASPLMYPYVPGSTPPYLLEIPGVWPHSVVIRVLAQRPTRDGGIKITDSVVQYINVATGDKPEGWPG